MNQTVRSLIVFVSVLITIAFLAPLTNSPRLGPGGSTITETYFGLLRFGTLTARMKEPDYEMSFKADAGRLAATIAIMAGYWGAVGFFLNRSKKTLPADCSESH